MVCLDTSFLIDMIKGKMEVKVIAEDFVRKNEPITVASPSVVELVRGLYLRGNLRHSSKKESEKIYGFLYSLTILTLDKDSAILAGKIEADLLNKGKAVETMDVLIGAIVLKNNETLITRNKKHFERIPNLEIMSY